MQVKLTDSKTKKPISDTVKWLGAAGHMMVFHKDGQTVVHSHPKEDAVAEALVKKGVVQFTARFPKTGMYKVYDQFKWRGSVHTVPFTIEVR